MAILNIERENRPAIYELSVGSNNQSLIVSVQQEAYSEVQKMLQEVGLRPWFLPEDLKLPQFLRPSNSWLWWGFGPVASHMPDQRNNFTSFEVALPKVVEYPPGYDQAKSLGLQKDPWEEGYDYTLWQPVVNWEFAHAVSGTLTTLFKCLSLIDSQLDSKRPQLMEVDMGTRLGDSYISVSLGKSMLPFLKLQPHNTHHHAGSIMRAAYEYMMGKSDSSMDRFEVWFRDNHWVNLICPGDRCGLDPGGYNKSEDGYSLYPHNVDSVAQQLTLLVGVAAIHQEARKMGF